MVVIFLEGMKIIKKIKQTNLFKNQKKGIKNSGTVGVGDKKIAGASDYVQKN